MPPCVLPAPLPLAQARRVLVFAPHPDDECIGCGGAIVQAVQAGAAVRVVLVSDGSGAGELPEGTAARRQQEFLAALAVLGVNDWVLLNLPDGALAAQPALAECLAEQLRAFAPDWVFGPAARDLHADHRAVAEALRQAAPHQPSLRWLCEYETWGAVPLTHVLDISAALELKLQALRCHATALACGNYLEAARGLAVYRGLLLGAGAEAAEAFACWRPEHGLPPFQAPQAAELARLRQREQQLLKTHARLELQLAQMTASQSWRLTAPLRAVRGALQPAALLRRLLPASARQGLKRWLVAQPWGAKLLSRLMAAPADSSASAAPQVDKEQVRAEAQAALDGFLASGARLRVPTPAGAPKVSVVVVLFNQAGLSLLCLQALLASRGVSFELLIVDNGSSDRVPELLQRIDGATVLRPGENLGFLRAVNQAAQHARGEHLLLLNNDALVFEDTLARAVQRLAAEPDAGAVGGPILWWDGRLQEAGSIIWRDATCQGYGRGDSPDAGPYRFVRDVDYCSGALLMVRRALFERLGGFDEAYAPAYYEESDLCARLWQAGQRVVYDPAVRVRHFEFASETKQGEALALQARNRAVFAAKHAGFLAARALPGAVLAARQRLRPGQLRVLVIEDRVPLPSLGRGYPRAAALIHALVQAEAAVTLYPLQIAHEDWAATYAALPERVEVMQGLGLGGLRDFLLARSDAFDLVLVSRPHNMELVQALRRQNPGLLGQAHWAYDAEALFAQRDIGRARVLGRPLSDAAQRRLIAAELALTQGMDSILTVSESEAALFRMQGSAQVRVLGHTLHSVPSTADFVARAGFLFVGALEGEDTPNTDSLLWFLREVWPFIRAELGPAATLDVVGPCETASVPGVAGPEVRIWGRVESLAPHYDQARVFIAPTRFAAGIPHKAHEAAAAGLPMVVSDLIAEQLGWTEPTLAHASAPQAFAQACLALYREPARWQAARAAALAAVQRDCSAQHFADTVHELLSATRTQKKN